MDDRQILADRWKRICNTRAGNAWRGLFRGEDYFDKPELLEAELTDFLVSVLCLCERQGFSIDGEKVLRAAALIFDRERSALLSAIARQGSPEASE